MAIGLSEKALLFGHTRSLAGILTDPPPGASGEGKPGVVILNAGLLHRVGPNRLHVQTARALAELGFCVLRFDLSGIGDSQPRQDGTGFRTAALEEIGEAFDLLADLRGVRRFVLVGICSGADNGLLAAYHDPRVMGAALIDGYNVPGWRYALFFYRHRFLSPRSWARVLLGRSEALGDLMRLASARSKETPRQATSLEVALPSHAEYVRQVRALADRGVPRLLVYTRDSPSQFNYISLLDRPLRAWPSRDRVSVEHFADSDHLFTLVANQQRLVRLLTTWANGLSGALQTAETEPGDGLAVGLRS